MRTKNIIITLIFLLAVFLPIKLSFPDMVWTKYFNYEGNITESTEEYVVITLDGEGRTKKIFRKDIEDITYSPVIFEEPKKEEIPQKSESERRRQKELDAEIHRNKLREEFRKKYKLEYLGSKSSRATEQSTKVSQSRTGYLYYDDSPSTPVIVVAGERLDFAADVDQLNYWVSKGKAAIVRAKTKAWQYGSKQGISVKRVQIAEGPHKGFIGWIPYEAWQNSK